MSINCTKRKGTINTFRNKFPLVTIFFLISYNIINVFYVISYYFLSTCFRLSFSICMFFMFPIHLYNWPYGCYPSTITIKSSDYYYYYYYYYHHLLYAGYLYLYSRDKLLLFFYLLFITLIQGTYNYPYLCFGKQ